MEEKIILSETEEEVVVGGTAETAESISATKCPKCGSSNVFVSRRTTANGEKVFASTCRDCGHTRIVRRRP